MSTSRRSLQSTGNHLIKGQRGGDQGPTVVGMCFRRMKCCLQRHGTEGLKKNSTASSELGAWCVRDEVGNQGRLQSWLEISKKRPWG